MSFDKKKNRKKDGKYVGYKNGLYLNRDLSEKSVWCVDDIKARTERLVADAVELFKFDDEQLVGFFSCQGILDNSGV